MPICAEITFFIEIFAWYWKSQFQGFGKWQKNFCVKDVDMISGGPAAIPKIYRSAESQDFPINPVKTQNKSFQTYIR